MVLCGVVWWNCGVEWCGYGGVVAVVVVGRSVV